MEKKSKNNKSSSPNQLKLIQIKKNSNNKHLSIKKQGKNSIERGRKLFEVPFKTLYYNDFNIIQISNKNKINKRRIDSKNSILKRNKTRRKKSINNSDNSNYSNSSSNSSREIRRKKNTIYNQNNDTVDYPSRKDVGLYSSEDEDSIENSILEDTNFINEIERILIEIYNKNISIISNNVNINDILKNKKKDMICIEIQINSYLKKLNVKCNLLVLKILSDKIRELISKYKEKILEIPEVKRIYDKYLRKKQKFKLDKISDEIKDWINEVYNNSSFQLNSLSELQYESIFVKNSMIIKPNEELTEKGITHVLLRELINIKKTLKISSKEIENIFKYPLSLLKDDSTGNKIYFSIEKIQMEEFDRIILKNNFITLVMLQIKLIFGQLKISEIMKLINEVEKDKDNYQNEKTKFDEFLENKLNFDNKINKNSSNKNFLLNSKENNENNNNHLNTKETLTSSSSNESENEKNEINDTLKNNNNNKKNNIPDNNFNINNIKDLDELVKFISDESDIRKVKKKKNKKKKGKKLIEDNIEEKKINIDTENINENEIDYELINVKKELENFSINNYSFNKIIPKLSKEFIEKLKK